MKKVTRKSSAKKSARKRAKPLAKAKARVSRAMTASSRARSAASRKPTASRGVAAASRSRRKSLATSPRRRRTASNKTASHLVGDSIESAGKFVEQGGFRRIGKAIRKIGNSVEHIQDR